MSTPNIGQAAGILELAIIQETVFIRLAPCAVLKTSEIYAHVVKLAEEKVKPHG